MIFLWLKDSYPCLLLGEGIARQSQNGKKSPWLMLVLGLRSCCGVGLGSIGCSVQGLILHRFIYLMPQGNSIGFRV